MQSIYLYFIIHVIILSTYKVISAKKIYFRVTSLKCEHDPEIYNGTANCFVKPFRNGTRLETIEYNFRKPCHDFWIHLMFFYKFGGTTQYRPWMFNNDEDLCAYYKGTAKPGIFFALIKRAMEIITPRTLHACPYYGVEGVTSINVGEIVSQSLPQVIPTGDYRLYIRFHTRTNQTFLQVTMGAHVDALNPMEAIGMGRK